MEGYNGRMDAIQAGLLRTKLTHLAKWNAHRRERASEYNCLFATAEESVVSPFEPSWSRGVYHLYVIRVDDRNGMMSRLKEIGIGTGIHYPIPLHLQKAYASLNYERGDFPVCEQVSGQILSLPMYPQLSAEQQARVAREVLQVALDRASTKLESGVPTELAGIEVAA
jgi:dTDP-4-amino-4,6-dideoxygalactose transaminase